jgi:hypothetical protein
MMAEVDLDDDDGELTIALEMALVWVAHRNTELYSNVSALLRDDDWTLFHFGKWARESKVDLSMAWIAMRSAATQAMVRLAGRRSTRYEYPDDRPESVSWRSISSNEVVGLELVIEERLTLRPVQLETPSVRWTNIEVLFNDFQKAFPHGGRIETQPLLSGPTKTAKKPAPRRDLCRAKLQELYPSGPPSPLIFEKLAADVIANVEKDDKKFTVSAKTVARVAREIWPEAFGELRRISGRTS